LPEEIEEVKSCYLSPPMLGLRTLTFSDGTQTGIVGLDVIMQDLYNQGKQANTATIFEIMERLEDENNLDAFDRKQCEEVFFEEYQHFIEMKLNSNEKENNSMTTQDANQTTKKKGLFNLFKGGKKEGGCCDMKIVPKEQSTPKSNCCNIKIVPKEQSPTESNKGNCCK